MIAFVKEELTGEGVGGEKKCLEKSTLFQASVWDTTNA